MLRLVWQCRIIEFKKTWEGPDKGGSIETQHKGEGLERREIEVRDGRMKRGSLEMRMVRKGVIKGRGRGTVDGSWPAILKVWNCPCTKSFN
jgi:hypothetical protein